MKLNILVAIITLFFITNLQAQTEEELIDFLHSGILTTKSKVVKVPIEIWNNLILLKVKVNGHNANFMWDNGFSVSGIDNSLVEPYQLLPYGDNDKIFSGIDGNNVKFNVDYLVCPKVEIKGITISNTPFLKFDTRVLTLTKKIKLDGVLGASIINKLNWRFNFDKNYVEISEKVFETEQGSLIFPFYIKPNNNHIMAIAFNDIETQCLVDFGLNSNEIEINKANAAHFSNAKATKLFGQSTISVSGMAPVDTVYNIKDNFTWKLANKELDFRPDISFSKFRQSVVLGNKIFRDRYNVVINTVRDTVYALSARVKPNSDSSRESHGFGVLNVDGKFRIAQIIANPNTIANDIQLNDEVISINGKKPKDFADNYSLLTYQKTLRLNHKKMVLKFINGTEISILPLPSIEFEFKNEKELW